jgi:hypothetical protein
MVVIEQYTTTQFNFLSNTKGRILYDTTYNAIRYNNNIDFNNFLLSKDSSNNVTGINNMTIDGTLNIANAGTGGVGLQLGGTLISVTGEQLNYNNVTPGIVSPTATMVVDSSRNINNLNRLNTTGNMGINTSANAFGLEVNHSAGNALRLSYDDDSGAATSKCDFTISTTGSLTIDPTGTNPSVTVLANLNTTSVSTTKQNTLDTTVDFPLSLTVLPDATPTAGLGSGIEFNTTNSAFTLFNLGTLEYYATTITDGAEDSGCRIRLANNSAFITAMSINNDGVIYATSFAETSDIRAKENIQDTKLIDSIDKIKQLNVKTYNYKKDMSKKNKIGLIAQEVLDIVPEVVLISKTDELDDFHQIHYTGLIPHLINCTKDIYDKLDEINNKLERYMSE